MRTLIEPEVSSLDINSEERFHAHRSILNRKKIIRRVFDEIQFEMQRLNQVYFKDVSGLEIELGAGVYPMKENFKNVLATDVEKGPLIDKVMSALDMDLPDQSVRVLYGQNCFHHFPDPELFFTECQRVLKKGGGVVLVDPAYTWLSGLLYPRLFKTESYDKNMKGWKNEAHGAMYGANQALAYIVFVRDFDLFQQKFPDLKIVHSDQLTNYSRYLLSGGLNFRPLIPSFLEPLAQFFESAFRPLRKIFGLHQVIVIQKQ